MLERVWRKGNPLTLLVLTSIESVMSSNYFILCHPLLLLPSVFPSIRVFSEESVLCIRWPKYWSFSFNISPSSESVMSSNHLILCHPLLLLPSVFPSIRVFSKESVLHIRWPKYWSFNFSISHSKEYSELKLVNAKCNMIFSPHLKSTSELAGSPF